MYSRRLWIFLPRMLNEKIHSLYVVEMFLLANSPYTHAHETKLFSLSFYRFFYLGIRNTHFVVRIVLVAISAVKKTSIWMALQWCFIVAAEIKFSMYRMFWIASCLFIKSCLFMRGGRGDKNDEKDIKLSFVLCFKCEISAHKTDFHLHECIFKSKCMQTHVWIIRIYWTNTCQFRMTMTFLLFCHNNQQIFRWNELEFI